VAAVIALDEETAEKALKWVRNKYKRFRYRIRAAKRWLKNVYKSNSKLFAHWSFGVRP